MKNTCLSTRLDEGEQGLRGWGRYYILLLSGLISVLLLIKLSQTIQTLLLLVLGMQYQVSVVEVLVDIWLILISSVSTGWG